MILFNSKSNNYIKIFYNQEGSDGKTGSKIS
jgi:hypothetical protein